MNSLRPVNVNDPFNQVQIIEFIAIAYTYSVTDIIVNIICTVYSHFTQREITILRS